jgi:mannose-6-phosphate isomerase-like protein (cupin superfamily)
MKELDKALRVAVKGPVADEALARHRRQMELWGIVMPPATPLVLDFGLGMFDTIGEIEHWIANDAEHGYCGKFLFVDDGQTCPMHYHRQKHETFYIVRGRVRMVCNGREREMRPGDVLVVEQNSPHAFTGIGPALLLEVSTAGLVDDNYFEDVNIPLGGNHKRADGDGRFHVLDGGTDARPADHGSTSPKPSSTPSRPVRPT